jgi:hypothetical protein
MTEPIKKKSLFSGFKIFGGKKKTNDSGTSPFSDAAMSSELVLYDPLPSVPSFNAPQDSGMQTTPKLNGHQIDQELKNLVNQIHQANPQSRIKMGAFRQAIARKLRDLGITVV